MTCRRLLATGIAGAMIFVLTYAIFVLTPFGQWIDDVLLEAFRAEELGRTALTSALHLINIATIALTGIIIIAIGAVRHRLTIGIVAVVAFGVSIVAAEVFKLILPRPEYQTELDEEIGKAAINTFPSGHSTIIAAGVIALLWAWGTANRAMWLLGAGVVIIVVSATVIAGWHRPSDGIGGISLGVSVMAISAWLLTCRGKVVVGSPIDQNATER